MVAALGWGPLARALGGIAAAIGLGALFGLPYCVAFAITVALPAWWLGHLALLGRPVDRHGTWQRRRAGRASARMVSGRPRPALDRGLCRADHDRCVADARHRRRHHHRVASQCAACMRSSCALTGTPTGEIDQLVDCARDDRGGCRHRSSPMMTLTLNLWLAAKITATSGRLQPPWPDVTSAASCRR